MTQTFRSTGALVWAARVAMLFLAALILGVGVVSGSGVGVVISTLLAAGLLVGLAATFRNAYVIDGTRVGHRNGLTGAVRRWVDAGDIALATANYDNAGASVVGAQTLVFWTRSGGSTGLSAALVRLTLSDADNEAIERAAAGDTLRPFAIPISTLGPQAKRAFEQFCPPRRG